MHQRSTPELAELLARLLRQASEQFDQAVTSHLGDDSVARWHVLAALSNGDGVPMSALAESTPLRGASFSRFIDLLVSENLVHRKVDPLDRRRVLIFRTRRGAMAFNRMEKLLEVGQHSWSAAEASEVVACLESFLARLNAEPAETASSALGREPS